MQNLRKYGDRPYSVAVVHGGPGAPGDMAPVAEELSSEYGILEPFQTAQSVTGQIDELAGVISANGSQPLILIGHSWGAWLVYLVAAYHQELVKKIILIGSGPFLATYTEMMMDTRLSRLNTEERRTAERLMKELENGPDVDLQKLFKEFGSLMSKADAYAPIPMKGEAIEVQPEIYQKVWPEAAALRKSGKLLALGKNITCPVVAIHGDYDPHPYKGVKKPLSEILDDFRFILLKKCGHKPWSEKHVKEKFYKILRRELGTSIKP